MPAVSSILTVVVLLAIGAAIGGVYVLLLRRSAVGRATVSSGGPDSTGRPGTSAPRPLSLRAVINRLGAVGDEETVLLDRPTGRFVMLADQLLAAVEGDDPVEDLIDDTVERLLLVIVRVPPELNRPPPKTPALFWLTLLSMIDNAFELLTPPPPLLAVLPKTVLSFITS